MPLMLARYMLSSCVCPCIRHKLMSANFTREWDRLYIKTLAVIKPMHRSVMFHFVSFTAQYSAMPLSVIFRFCNFHYRFSARIFPPFFSHVFLVASIKLIGNLWRENKFLWKGPISEFQGFVTLNLKLDRVMLHTVMHHSSTSTYTPIVIEIEETSGRTDRRTDIWDPLY